MEFNLGGVNPFSNNGRDWSDQEIHNNSISNRKTALLKRIESLLQSDDFDVKEFSNIQSDIGLLLLNFVLVKILYSLV